MFLEVSLPNYVFIGVHESNGKRQRRATDFVFSRQQTPEVGNDSATPSPAPQGVRRIKQIHRAASSQSLRTSSTQATIQTDPAREQSSGQLGVVPAGGLAKDCGQQTITPSTDSVESHQSLSGNDATPTSVQNAPPRRFHISRSATPTNPLGPFSSGIRKKPTVFTERRPVRPLSREGLPRSPDGQAMSEVAPAEQSRPQKKPGLAARNTSEQVKDASITRTAQLAAPVSARNVRLPSGAMMAWDVNSEQLAAEMQAYTLQEIGRSLAESEATKPGFKPSAPTSYLKSKESRFKPKKPSLRYQERHPEDAIQRGSGMDIDEPYLEDDMDEDSDYIIDTYIRMSADVLESSDDQKNVGLLVLESQPDIDEFYRDDDESEEEDDEEEEDENGLLMTFNHVMLD